MQELATVYWLGAPLRHCSPYFVTMIEKRFRVIDCQQDMAILSDKKVRYCFFFYRPQYSHCLKSALIMCQNLDKKLIIIHANDMAKEVPSHATIADCYQLNPRSAKEWLDQVEIKYFLDLSQHAGLKTFNGQIDIGLSPALLYVSENLQKDIREEVAAELCHYSVTYFSKVFKKKVGMCFRDYVTHQRIGLAKRLLTQSESSKIAYIAYQCGYNDVSYFSRIFKKKTGSTPAAYRLTF